MELYNVIWGLMQLGQTSLAHTRVFTLLFLKYVQMLMLSKICVLFKGITKFILGLVVRKFSTINRTISRMATCGG